MKVTEETRQLLHGILENGWVLQDGKQVHLSDTPEGRALWVRLNDPLSEDKRREQMLRHITELQAHNTQLLETLRDAKRIMEKLLASPDMLATLTGQLAAQQKSEPNRLAQKLLDSYAAEGTRILVGATK